MKRVQSITALGVAFLLSLLITISSSAQQTDATKTDEKNVAATPEKTAAQTPIKQTDERYRIGYQDTIEVTVARHADFSGVFNVAQDGTIILPRLSQPISAVCKTERELAGEIVAQLKTILVNPFVNVRAIDQKSQSFAVIGAVEKPGSFYINRRIRLLELLSFAGGPNKEAGTKMIVARTGSTSGCQSNNENVAANADDPGLVLSEFTIKDVQQGKVNFWMQPGDIVSVLEADLIYVVGNVNKPKTIELKEKITLTQAIAAAEGIKSATKKDKVRILRQKPDSIEREELFFDIVAIDKKQIQDPVLQPNDIVDVPTDGAKKTVRGILDVLKGNIGGAIYKL